MPNFLVDVLYDPGVPKMYLVEGVADAEAARDHVRTKIIHYDPGVPVLVTELPINSGKVTRFPNLGEYLD